MEDLQAQHLMLSGPRAHADAIAAALTVVQADHTERHPVAPELLCAPPSAPPGGVPGKPTSFLDPECLAAHGVQLEYIYQPLSRFWPLQAIEPAILVCAAAVLLATAAWWTTRRTS